MIVNIKKLSKDAVIPSYAKSGDAGMDITCISMTETTKYIEYGTGLSFEIPENHVGLIFPRSSLSNYDLVLSNHVGVIDSQYRGEVKFRFKKTSETSSAKHYKVGDRVGQLVILPYPHIQLKEVDELSDTERGTGGFGSSDTLKHFQGA